MRYFKFDTEEAMNAYFDAIRRDEQFERVGDGRHVDEKALAKMPPLPVVAPLTVAIPEKESVEVPRDAAEVTVKQPSKPGEKLEVTRAR